MARRDAVKIADHVRYGAVTPPLVFATQLTRLPSQWRVSSVYYLPDGGLLRVSRFALGTGNPDLGADGGLEYQTNLPYFSTIDSATSRSSFCGKSASEIINGYRVTVTHRAVGTLPSQDLCAANADGLALSISQFGAHPPSTWPACSGTTCGCSALTRRTGPRNLSDEQDRRPRARAGDATCGPARPARLATSPGR